MRSNRPVFLEPWRIELPINALVSILHRISGFILIVSIPYAAHLLERSLSGPAGFAAVSATLDTGFARLVLVVIAWAWIHHLLAGIRFLALDLGLGHERLIARRSAWTAMAAALALVAGGGLML